MSPDLHTRLLAALDERLEIARAATPGPWHLGLDGRSVMAPDDFVVHDYVVPSIGARKEWPSREDARHIRHNDPASEIRRVEALRRVVERHAPEVIEWALAPASVQCRACQYPYASEDDYPCDVIRDLAAGEGIEVGS